MVTDGVSESNNIEPSDGHSLPIVGAREQFLYELLIGLGRAMVNEILDFLVGRRETHQVAVESADQRSTVRFLRGSQSNIAKSTLDEEIDGVDAVRDGLFDGLFVCPVFLVDRTCLDPSFQKALLVIGEFLVGERRWHQRLGVFGIDSFPEKAGLSVMRDNRVGCKSVLSDV